MAALLAKSASALHAAKTPRMPSPASKARFESGSFSIFLAYSSF